MKTGIRFIALVAFCLLSGCGGGGGGSGSGSKVGLRVLNGAIDSPPVGLYSSLAEAGPLSIARFALATERIKLPEGEQVVTLARGARSAEVLLSMPFPAERSASQTLLVYGNRSNLGLRYALISDEAAEPEGDQGLLRVIHALNGAAAIDIAVEGAAGASIAFGAASEYVALPTGTVRITVKRSADQAVVFAGVRTIQARKRLTVMITGQADYFVSAVDNMG